MKRRWQTGILRSSERRKVPVDGGVVKMGPSDVIAEYEPFTGANFAVYDTHQWIVIEDKTGFHRARQKLKRPWSRAAKLIVNEKVTFAVEDDQLFVIDTKGKERNFELMSGFPIRDPDRSRRRR
jgi:hypothetical protein